MRKLLREFYNDELLSSELRFKGGTASMLFEGLPRFSTDLDFNLENKDNQHAVFERIVDIVSHSGRIVDSAEKLFGPIVVLNYGVGERNLKVEVSNRLYDNHYEARALGNMLIPVMSNADILSHKMCAMLDRRAPRDVFDVWYFMSKGWTLNDIIVKERTGLSVKDFLRACSVAASKVSPTSMMAAVGELLDDSMKTFVRSGAILSETIGLLDDYMALPLLAKQNLTEHSRLLFADERLLPAFQKNNIDPSEISSDVLSTILAGGKVSLRNKNGAMHFVQLKSGKYVVS